MSRFNSITFQFDAIAFVTTTRLNIGFYSARATSMPSPQRLGLQGLISSFASSIIYNINTLYINNRFAVIVFTDPYYIALHSAAHYYFDPSAHENKHRSPISLCDTISLHPFLYILSCFKADFLDQAGN